MLLRLETGLISIAMVSQKIHLDTSHRQAALARAVLSLGAMAQTAVKEVPSLTPPLSHYTRPQPHRPCRVSPRACSLCVLRAPEKEELQDQNSPCILATGLRLVHNTRELIGAADKGARHRHSPPYTPPVLSHTCCWSPRPRAAAIGFGSR